MFLLEFVFDNSDNKNKPNAYRTDKIEGEGKADKKDHVKNLEEQRKKDITF